MQPAPRRLSVIAALGLAIAGGIGALGLVLSHSVATGSAGLGRLALLLLAGLALTAVAGLTVLLRLLARSDELRRVNRALADRNRELEAASVARSRFVANLSHELRNPLSAVIGYAELMSSGRCGVLDDRQHEHVGVIRDSGQHLLTLIEELLDTARVEAGQLRLESAPVDPAAVIRGCAASLRTMAERDDVELELDMPGAGLVMLDPTRLRQVVLNFVSNAIKFSPRGATAVVRLRYADAGIRVEVTDAGPGLSAEHQSRVFDEFFQVPGTERSGTGLGLAITRLLVDAQGGHVSVRSTPGMGSTFAAWLPAPGADTVVELARPPRSLSLGAAVRGPAVLPGVGC